MSNSTQKTIMGVVLTLSVVLTAATTVLPNERGSEETVKPDYFAAPVLREH